MNQRLQQQLRFIVEADKLKQVIRHNLLHDESRRENVAEHTWHSTLSALLLSEYSAVSIDLFQVLKLITIHDLVEIYAGDTFFFDEAGYTDKYERELKSLDTLCELLPTDQGEQLRAWWHEFEVAETPEGLFANAIDKLMPVLLNSSNSGQSWRKNGITASQVQEKLSIINKAAPQLGQLLTELIEKAIAEGSLINR